jgi:hypothetical protein
LTPPPKDWTAISRYFRANTSPAACLLSALLLTAATIAVAPGTAAQTLPSPSYTGGDDTTSFDLNSPGSYRYTASKGGAESSVQVDMSGATNSVSTSQTVTAAASPDFAIESLAQIAYSLEVVGPSSAVDIPLQATIILAGSGTGNYESIDTVIVDAAGGGRWRRYGECALYRIFQRPGWMKYLTRAPGSSFRCSRIAFGIVVWPFAVIVDSMSFRFLTLHVM